MGELHPAENPLPSELPHGVRAFLHMDDSFELSRFFFWRGGGAEYMLHLLYRGRSIGEDAAMLTWEVR